MRLLIHGGSGTIPKANMTGAKEADYHAALKESLVAGFKILQAGGSSVDAVKTAVQVMEDCTLFNAGHGAVITSSGGIELDAAIMDGKTLKAGAVAGVAHIRNPVMLADLIMTKSEHVMLTGSAAEAFAQSVGMELIEAGAHITPEKLKRWKEFKNRKSGPRSEYDKHGTVGAVAIDAAGNLAAATSTGGMMNKTPGRVGDSPIIGAGTYADNNTCAVSATGHGEYFIRLVIAYDIAAHMKYQGLNLVEAAAAAIKRLDPLGGTGGVIAIDKFGNTTMPFNTEGMYRGFIDEQNLKTEIY